MKSNLNNSMRQRRLLVSLFATALIFFEAFPAFVGSRPNFQTRTASTALRVWKEEVGTQVIAKVGMVDKDFIHVTTPAGQNGRIHASEVSVDRSIKTFDVAEMGGDVKCFIKTIRDRDGMLALTMKDRFSGKTKLSELKVGTVTEGKVYHQNQRIGAFVEINAVVGALIPLKSFDGWANAERFKSLQFECPVDEFVTVEVTEVNIAKGTVTAALVK
eukprot:TRINITY_DN4086_c0_g4_i1.p1 TRINITY_DN4086_c0_g4~~TRINITY_DN4086_c0_g4_i1.p1  ORF type:complete len:216 (-),score=12.67 TRINITY_DN4086_c0_g4_i1:149-796(-)